MGSVMIIKILGQKCVFSSLVPRCKGVTLCRRDVPPNITVAQELRELNNYLFVCGPYDNHQILIKQLI